ncbi:MAG: hypothetical protein R2713_17280, partial [Ilumatobacteraceae bacterium]
MSAVSPVTNASALRGQDGHRGPGLLRRRAEVRDQHHVVAAEQSLVHLWFVFEHVEAGAGDAPRLQGGHERRFVHHGASGGVHQERFRTHRRQLGLADQVPGLGCERTVQRHDVARGEQLVERHVGRTELGRDRRIDAPAIRVGDRHAERLRPAGEGGADLAHADHPQPASLQAGAEHHGHAPSPRLTRPDEPLALTEAPRDHQDQRHRQIGGGVGEHAGGVGGGHRSLPARGEVDVVVADGHVAHRPQLRSGGVEQFGVHPLGEQRHERVRADDSPEQLVARHRVVLDPGVDVVTGRPQQLDARFGDPAGDHDATSSPGHGRICTIASISTQMSNGSSATPIADRAARPASPNTSMNSSEHPSITAGVLVKPGAVFTMPSSFTTR